MNAEIMRQIIETIEADATSRPTAIEFEMAYQARVAVDRIKFAIRHAEQFAKPCDAMREAGIQLLDALQRLESLDRRFQARSRNAASHRNGNLRGLRMNQDIGAYSLGESVAPGAGTKARKAGEGARVNNSDILTKPSLRTCSR